MSPRWTVRLLGDLCSKIGSGATPRGGSGVYVREGTALIRSQNVYNGGFQSGGLAYITESAADNLAGVTVREGDVLLNITGDSVARACQVPTTVLPARVNQHVAILRSGPELDARYLRYKLVEPETQRRLLSLAAAGATRKALTKGMLERLSISLPPIEEQRAIASVLGALDDKIELNRRTNETLEALARAIFTSWFVDFDPVRARAEGRQPVGMDAETAALFPDSFADSPLGPVPSGWYAGALGDVVAMNRRSRLPGYPHDEIDYVDIASVKEGRLESSTPMRLADAPSRARRLVEDGDVIWSCVRPNRRSYLRIDNPPDNRVVSTGFVVLTPTIVPSSYLYLSVATDDFVDYLTANADGSAYPAVRPEHFDRAPLLIPDEGALRAFDVAAEPLLRRLAANERESRTLAETRDALLPKLVSGEIRVAPTAAD